MASLNVYIVTFNCARQPIDTDSFASHLFDVHESPALPDILVISLQEIAPIPQSFIGGSFLDSYFARFEKAVHAAVQKRHDADAHNGYQIVSKKTIGMTGIMVFAKDISAFENVETAGVGVGIWNMGNKGAAAVRFSYLDTSNHSVARTEFTFVSAHLCAFEEEVLRRNEDWKNIVRGLVFSSTKQTASHRLSRGEDERPLLSVSPAHASIYKPTSHLFVAGDLNYRTSIRRPAHDDHLITFPQPNQPESSSKHYSKLFENDQLNQERSAGRTLFGLTEAPVSFGPTYKFDSQEPSSVTNEEQHWPWAKHRWPSWCDRCLYLEIPQWLKKQHPKAKIVVHKYSSLPLLPTSDHRPVAISLSVPILPIPSPDTEEEEDDADPRIKPPFNIDPDWKSKRERARTLEILIGFSLFFTSTREGIVVSLIGLATIVGCYFVLRSFF